MSVIDEVKQRTDIVEVLGQYASLTKAGRTFRALCPFHSEKHASFFVYPEQQSWHCFGACNTGGDVFSFMMKKQGIDFGEALRLLAERAGITLPSKSTPQTGGEGKERLYQINEAASRYFHDLLLDSPAAEKAKSYIVGRGMSLQTLAEFQLGFSLNSWEALKQHLLDIGYTENELLTAGLLIEGESGKTHDRFRNRLMFPIQDIKDRVVGFGARALDDSQPKYLNSPQTPIFDKSGNLYALNLATEAIRQQDRAVIVEGYMDAITAHQHGFKNVIASLGTSVTEKQISTLKKLTKNIILALDADAAGQEAMLRGIDYENTLGAEVKVIVLPEGKDPDDVIKEDNGTWQHLLEEALPIVDYTFNMVMANLNLSTAGDKSIAANRLLPIVAGIKDIVRQSHYFQKLARLISVRERSLEALLNDIKTKQTFKKGNQDAVTATPSAQLSSPLEEYCLALLLQHPELKARSKGFSPEHFENSEYREIFIIWQQVDNLGSVKDILDTALHDLYDSLITRNLPPTQIELKYQDSFLNLRKKYLQNLAAKRALLLALEAESGGTLAALAKLEEQGIEVSTQLGEVFTQKNRRGQENRR